MLFKPTVSDIAKRALHDDTGTLHRDSGYWGARVDRAPPLWASTIWCGPQAHTQPRRSQRASPDPAEAGWRVERINSWLTRLRPAPTKH